LRIVTEHLEQSGYDDWDIGFTGNHREARVWKWPRVVGRYNTMEKVPPKSMVFAAMMDAGLALPYDPEDYVVDALVEMLECYKLMMRDANHKESFYQNETLRAMNSAPLLAERTLSQLGVIR